MSLDGAWYRTRPLPTSERRYNGLARRKGVGGGARRERINHPAGSTGRPMNRTRLRRHRGRRPMRMGASRLQPGFRASSRAFQRPARRAATTSEVCACRPSSGALTPPRARRRHLPGAARARRVGSGRREGSRVRAAIRRVRSGASGGCGGAGRSARGRGGAGAGARTAAALTLRRLGSGRRRVARCTISMHRCHIPYQYETMRKGCQVLANVSQAIACAKSCAVAGGLRSFTLSQFFACSPPELFRAIQHRPRRRRQ